MTSQAGPTRWVAPFHEQAHPRLALVRHEERLFSYSDLLHHTPKKYAFAVVQSGVTTPQEWWNELSRNWPIVARRTIARCQSRDGEVLDLFVSEPEGSA